MTLAITGATGHLGRLVIARLKTHFPQNQLVALARSPDKAADLEIPCREADYTKPHTLDAALKGIDTLLLISASDVGQRVAQHRNILAAAKANAVRWIVYTSLLHTDTSTIDLAAEHRQSEADLLAGGIPTTTLRNGWYIENYAGAIQGAAAGGMLTGTAAGGKISSASRADYADAAFAVLTSHNQQGKLYELAGDTAWTMADLAAELSRQTGRQVTYKNMPPADYAKALQSASVPADFARLIAGWGVAAANGALFDDSRQLSKLIGRPTTPMPQSLRQMLQK